MFVLSHPGITWRRYDPWGGSRNDDTGAGEHAITAQKEDNPMERKISQQVRGYRTEDGAGVSLVRVLGNQTVQAYDPILMLDSFDSTNQED